MTTTTKTTTTTPTRADADESLCRWIEQRLGGRVVAIEPFARWRSAWNIDLERDGRVVQLHARGERELHFAIPFRLADEAPIHDLLEAHGLPVPHCYGICEEPRALVMDRLSGRVDLTFADTDSQRLSLIDAYLELLPSMYAIAPERLVSAGLSVPTDARGVALSMLERFEKLHDELMPERDPVAAFLRRWLHRNYPRDRKTAAFVTYDAFQFMFEDGKITGLLDFELATVGDPMMDLAALRIRDTIKNLGDLSAIAHRFSEVTGWAVDHDAVEYHCVLYNTLTVLSAGPPLLAPTTDTDYVSHLAWYVNSARWAFEVMGEMLGFELETLEAPTDAPSSEAPLHRVLVDGMRLLNVDGVDSEYRRTCLRQLARHLRRRDEIGDQLARDDAEDVSRLVGRRVKSDEKRTALLAFIDTAGPEHDIELARTLDRIVQRRHLTMAPAGSLMLRHPKLRSLRPDRQIAVGADDGWPAGSIPGT